MNQEASVMADVEALIKNLELPYLKKVQRHLEQEIKNREDRTITDAIAQMHKIAAQFGKRPEDLLKLNTKVKAAKPVTSAPVKYRHPTQPELHWAGRGRTPQWIVEWTTSGKKLEDLAV